LTERTLSSRRARSRSPSRRWCPFPSSPAFGSDASIKTLWILSDEFTYSEFAKSDAHQGHFLVRGVPRGVVSFLYPVLIAPAWLAGSTHTTYLLAKAINSVLMSLVAVPIHLWGSRIAPRS
jgi:hypothetical protein